MGKLRIALTGTTGLLGRNLLFEFIKQYLNKLDFLEIFILGRDKSDGLLYERIVKILADDGVNYLGLKNISEIDAFIKEKIHAVCFDLDSKELCVSSDDLDKLKKEPIDYFFHVAALTDFRSTKAIIDALYRTNVEGTKKILELVSSIKVKEFCYVGSAYSCGNISGDIKPDDINFSYGFRNPYERTKLEAESLVRFYSKLHKLKCRYFRPSTICGRLIENELGSICKFDVFYAWAAWFLRYKLKMLKNCKHKYNDPFDMDMRIAFNPNSGLNIVPADFCAKVMYQACMQDDPNESYHLVNKEETPHACYIPIMVELFNMTGLKYTKTIPDNKNKIENFYYKTVGAIFSPYILSGPMLFNTDNLNELLRKVNLQFPIVNEQGFKILLNYAKKQNFGIN